MDGVSSGRKKWGDAAVNAGFTIIPNHLIAFNQFVQDEEKRLSPTEMVVALQILATWWSADKLPFPSKTTIADRSGLSPRQVQRALGSLDSKGYVTRISRFASNRARTSNQFDVGGLVKAVAEAAEKNPSAFKRQSVAKAE